MVLVGVHPSFTQQPPMWELSIKAVFWPALAKALARGVPAWPEPMIIAWYFVGEDILKEEKRLTMDGSVVFDLR
jgi:hypothetical protein